MNSELVTLKKITTELFCDGKFKKVEKRQKLLGLKQILPTDLDKFLHSSEIIIYNLSPSGINEYAQICGLEENFSLQVIPNRSSKRYTRPKCDSFCLCFTDPNTHKEIFCVDSNGYNETFLESNKSKHYPKLNKENLCILKKNVQILHDLLEKPQKEIRYEKIEKAAKETGLNIETFMRNALNEDLNLYISTGQLKFDTVEYKTGLVNSTVKNELSLKSGSDEVFINQLNGLCSKALPNLTAKDFKCLREETYYKTSQSQRTGYLKLRKKEIKKLLDNSQSPVNAFIFEPPIFTEEDLIGLGVENYNPQKHEYGQNVFEARKIVSNKIGITVSGDDFTNYEKEKRLYYINGVPYEAFAMIVKVNDKPVKTNDISVKIEHLFTSSDDLGKLKGEAGVSSDGRGSIALSENINEKSKQVEENTLHLFFIQLIRQYKLDTAKKTWLKMVELLKKTCTWVQVKSFMPDFKPDLSIKITKKYYYNSTEIYKYSRLYWKDQEEKENKFGAKTLSTYFKEFLSKANEEI